MCRCCARASSRAHNKVDQMPLPTRCVLAPPVPYKARMQRASVAHATAELVGLISSRHVWMAAYMHIVPSGVRFLPSAAALCLVRHQVYTNVTISSL